MQFQPSGLTLSGRWDLRCSGQCQPCIRRPTTLLGGGYRGTGWYWRWGLGGLLGAPMLQGSTVSRNKPPPLADDNIDLQALSMQTGMGPTPGRQPGDHAEKSDPKKTPTLTRAMRNKNGQ